AISHGGVRKNTKKQAIYFIFARVSALSHVTAISHAMGSVLGAPCSGLPASSSSPVVPGRCIPALCSMVCAHWSVPPALFSLPFAPCPTRPCPCPVSFVPPPAPS
ncbi:unnamed protein product, partial [Laminaria digitata]